MATVLEDSNTEEQRSVVHFLWAKGLSARIFIKKRFLLMVGRFCRIKLFTAWWQTFADYEEVETDVRKWLRQQSKDF
jgi:hypothetical protein